MKSPWTKKNPLLSMYLSGANAIAGAARGRASAEIKRRSRTMMTTGTRQMMDLWIGAFLAPRSRRKRKAR